MIYLRIFPKAQIDLTKSCSMCSVNWWWSHLIYLLSGTKVHINNWANPMKRTWNLSNCGWTASTLRKRWQSRRRLRRCTRSNITSSGLERLCTLRATTSIARFQGLNSSKLWVTSSNLGGCLTAWRWKTSSTWQTWLTISRKGITFQRSRMT